MPARNTAAHPVQILRRKRRDTSSVIAFNAPVAVVPETTVRNAIMKFYISEGNIGGSATREQTDQVIASLKEKGWDVTYGVAENTVTDIAEFGREGAIQDAFADDFVACLDAMGL